ncbi:hypothetical protein [Rhodococcus sp. ARC_M6]|uniref:hypothetical protein n=1 Tax=Rhodococcus sp. ARC_M6 TaxID=2928852 RepID=UPI001FB2FBB7|nr:hypothetical protein [Rhodococcus sp. ARC_M6]MCJ0906384.1 hypothetical protein [Rhodococcus sp. ARC_M6]
MINIADPKNPPGDLSIGQLNPIFTQQVAGALAPYVGDMVGVDEKYTGTGGFGDLGPVEATRVFALLDGDPKAGGIINGAALAQASALDKAFAVGAVNGEDSWLLGYSSGNLHALVEAGLGAEVVDRNLDSEAADAALRQQRSEAYGVSQWLAAGVVSFIPGGAVINPLANSVALMLQDDYVNGAGAAVSATPSYSGESFTTGLGIDNIRMHSMLSALVEDGRVDVNDLNQGLVRDGRLMTLDEMDRAVGLDRTVGMIPNALETAGVSGIDRLDYLRVADSAGVAVGGIIFPDHLGAGESFNTMLVNGVGNQRANGWPR